LGSRKNHFAAPGRRRGPLKNWLCEFEWNYEEFLYGCATFGRYDVNRIDALMNTFDFIARIEPPEGM
jgi:hypothetical protein